MTTPDSAPAVALEPKTKLSGKILKTTLAGALVDIGQSVPGVIHISQLQQDAVNKVEDVLKAGQMVTVKLLGIDDAGKPKLSRKVLLPKEEAKPVSNEAPKE